MKDATDKIVKCLVSSAEQAEFLVSPQLTTECKLDWKMNGSKDRFKKNGTDNVHQTVSASFEKEQDS